MKRQKKSAPFYISFAIISCALLQGCADVPVPSWLTGEPDASVLEAQRAVGRPSSRKEKDFPNLASVPAKPAGLSQPKDLAQDVKDLEQDRIEGDMMREGYAREKQAQTSEQK